ncbi:MAG: sodium-extruding oxaloacetate decarboxylase subunit alpha [Spirochaetaceae bacterium]|jgi:oxaloacetate decarboxylase alpha subunit|nr:sodium-extruding oxaloacetate decarboxylase subunit alpha [Spirochaetaceae bacterium]
MSKVKITDLVLRDAHQSLFATRMTTADMVPALDKLDKIGYWALEAWGGATFDSCIRFLNEDPWERLRTLKKALPNTQVMMLLRGQNLLGYRHYADDVVDMFVQKAAENGVGVFRIFDACNDPRNLKRAADAAKKTGKHVQMAISYATTPYHTKEIYADLAKRYAESGADSICIKDMSGLLKPYEAFDLVKAIKAKADLPVEIHTHATTGLSVATLVKSAEAGAEILDTVISSVAMGTSHSPTETIVEAFKGTVYDTGLDIKPLLEIAAYFREVRKKYAKFESSFLGADTRILASQVPGGMLSNLENQLKEQGAADKIDEVLKEIQVVQKDCGYIPLVTPTSQIVGTQAVFNVLFGRYERLTAETADLVTGRYGALAAPANPDLVKKALEKSKYEAVLTERPADKIPNEFAKIEQEAKAVGAVSVEDALTFAMFPKVAPEFFKNRAKGPVDSASFVVKPAAPSGTSTGSGAGGSGQAGAYVVNVNGSDYNVTVRPSGTLAIVPAGGAAPASGAVAPAPVGSVQVPAPVAGTVLRYVVAEGADVKSGDTVVIIESMKMELEIKSTVAGKIHFLVPTGTQVQAQQAIASIGGVVGAAPVVAPAESAAPAPVQAAVPASGTVIPAPVAGTILRYAVAEGASVKSSDTVIIIESMKMELEIKSTVAGTVRFLVPTGTQVQAQQPIAEVK